MVFPELLKHQGISEDAKERVKYYRANVSNVGAYTSNSKGMNYVR